MAKEQVSKEVTEEKVSKKVEVPREISVTRQQYRQIDFLRLFRLCRNLGLFNRKRKMPTEYSSGDENSDDKNARSACRRLLRILIVHIFPETCNIKSNIKSNFSNYFIEFSTEMRNALSYLNNVIYDLQRSKDKEYREAAEGYRHISTHVGGYVYPRIPYSIKICFSADQRRRYRDVRRVAMGQNVYGEFVFKPPEDFYNCAMACLQYKEHWDKYSDLLIKVAERHKREREEKKRVEVQQRTLREERYNAERAATQAESARVLADAVAHSAEHGLRNTQASFNRALQNLLDRRENDEI